MTDDTKIQYHFYNEKGETTSMTFSLIEIEGAVGGFMKQAQKMVNAVGFGEIKKVVRILV